MTHLWLIGRVEQDHVLHVLVHVPWVRFDEVKAVVHDDPMDPVILCLVAVLLVSLPPVVVQVSSACLTYKEVHWFYIYKNIIHLAHPLLHSCGLQLPEPPEAIRSKISVRPNGLKILSLFVLVVQTAVVQMSL